MNDQADTAGGAGADLLAGAAALDAEAGRLDQAAAGAAAPGGAAPGAAAPGAAAVVDFAADARELVEFAGECFFPLWPRLAGIYTPEKRAAITARLGPVLRKHNLSLERILGQWGAEIMLAAAVLPAVVPTYQAIKADNRDAAEKAKAEARGERLPPNAQPAPHQPAPPPPPRDKNAPPPPPTDTTKLHQEGNPAFAPPPRDATQLHRQA